MALGLSLAVCDYDRTRAIFDGRAKIEGCDITAVPLEPEEAFHRAFKFSEFDISEISLSSYIMTTARGDAHYIAIPAFVSRLFRHSGIYIRSDRGIARAADLKGKTIGLPEYQITANVWIRGILKDEYGIAPADIKWRRGGLEDPGRDERAAIALPPEIELYEPGLALFGGPDGMDPVRRLLPMVEDVRLLALEVGLAEAVASLVAGAGFSSVEILDDLAGHERVVVGRR